MAAGSIHSERASRRCAGHPRRTRDPRSFRRQRAPKAFLHLALLVVGALASMTLAQGTSAQILPPTEAPAQESADDASAWLGVVMEHAPGGVLVRGTFPGSAAAGVLERDDIILAVDGESVDDPRALSALLGQRRPGEAVTLSVRRGDRTLEPALVLTSRPEDIHDAARLHVGQTFPRIALALAREEAVTWPGPQGERTVLVAFWATWCGSCRMLEPRLAELLGTCGDALEVVMVAPHDAEEVRDAERRRALPATPLADPSNELADTLNVTRLPTWVVVDGAGRISTVAIGVSEILAMLESAPPCSPAGQPR